MQRFKNGINPRIFDFKINSHLKTLAVNEKLNYGLQLSNVPQQWLLSKGEGIKICVLDTGSPINHPDLKNQIDASVNFTSDPIKDLVVGHSSAVSGIILAEENENGVVGIAPKARLYIAKVLDDEGSGDDNTISRGINWAIQQNVDIINMSFGAPSEAERYLPKIKKACQDAYNAGIFLVAAAGNENASIGVPAKFEECVAVAAIDSKKQRAWFSNKGVGLDFAAAGVNIVSTYINNSFAIMSGTSFSAPQICGIAALVLSEHHNRITSVNTPINNQKDLKAHLKKISIDLGKVGFDTDFGDGMPLFGFSPAPPPPIQKKPIPKPKPVPPKKKKR